MHTLKAALIASIMISGLAASAAQANSIANPGFELSISYDLNPPFDGNWEAFEIPPLSQAFNDTTLPHGGQQHLTLSIDGADNLFALVFQDVAVAADTIYYFGGWHMTPSVPLDLGIEFRIEWRNSTLDVEVARTPNSTTSPSGQYEQFLLSAAAPVGADTARVVYAIQTFGIEPTNNGVVYVDDMWFSSEPPGSGLPAVPEPASVALVGLGVVALVGRRASRA